MACCGIIRPVATSFVSILLVAFGLSPDCFAVALGVSAAVKEHFWRRALRLSFFFGLFQGVMPIIGWLAGSSIVGLIEDYDHWVAFGLLALVGGHMLWEAFRGEEERKTDIGKMWVILTLSVATSIDALAVGLSLAFLEVNIGLASLTIALVAFAVTLLGFVIGRRAGRLLGRRAEAVGGLILIAIGIKVLLEHMV